MSFDAHWRKTISFENESNNHGCILFSCSPMFASCKSKAKSEGTLWQDNKWFCEANQTKYRKSDAGIEKNANPIRQNPFVLFYLSVLLQGKHCIEFPKRKSREGNFPGEGLMRGRFLQHLFRELRLSYGGVFERGRFELNGLFFYREGYFDGIFSPGGFSRIFWRGMFQSNFRFFFFARGIFGII